MAVLLRAALDVVRDADAPHGLRAVAAKTLLAAFEHEVETPPGASLAVWCWLSTVGGDCVRFSQVSLPGPEVVLEAVAALKNPGVGEDLMSLAATAIEKSKDLGAITDEDVLAIVDGEPGIERVRRLVWILQAIHEVRGLPNVMLQALRDRWARSARAHLRQAAVQVAGLLPGLDKNFAVRMLDDTAPGVRSEIVDLLEQAEGEDRDRALGLLRQRLAVEEHVRVRSDLHSAIGTLLRNKSLPPHHAGPVL
jgi:hypothetical protein